MSANLWWEALSHVDRSMNWYVPSGKQSDGSYPLTWTSLPIIDPLTRIPAYNSGGKGGGDLTAQEV